MIQKDKKKALNVLIGRIYWKENFLDEDTGNHIPIVRNVIVRRNGEWLIKVNL